MSGTRIVLGFVAGAIFVASAAAHSLLGWPALRTALGQANAPGDLVAGLALGWHFAGAAMLTFGIIVMAIFNDLRRHGSASLVAARLIAAAYVAFGIGALGVSGLDPFFLVFIVPGMLLGAACWPRIRA